MADRRHRVLEIGGLPFLRGECHDLAAENGHIGTQIERQKDRRTVIQRPYTSLFSRQFSRQLNEKVNRPTIIGQSAILIHLLNVLTAPI